MRQWPRRSSTWTCSHLTRWRNGSPPASSLLVECDVSYLSRPVLTYETLHSTWAGEPLLEAAQCGRDGGDVGLGRRCRLGFEVDDDGATGAQRRPGHLADVVRPLTFQGGIKVGSPQALVAQRMFVVPTVLDDDRLGALEEPGELGVGRGRADDDGVDGDEHCGSDQPADQRVVRSDHRVLYDVRQQQDDDEVEGVELRQVTFADEAEQHRETDVDDDGADDLLQQRDVHVNEAVTHAASVSG